MLAVALAQVPVVGALALVPRALLAGPSSVSSTAPTTDAHGGEAPPEAPAPAPAPTVGTEALLSNAPPSTALAAVVLLEVKGRAPRTGYERDLFGSGWVDVDRNGCDTRNDVLRRDLTGAALKAGTQGCVVLSGRLADPYSGTTIDFVRGGTTSTVVQIDHVVALSDAWQKGAQQWDEQTRVAFANAPLNLLAVDGRLNQQKAAGDSATWLPPNKPFRCAYVARQVAVKVTFGLWVTAAEKDAMVGVLSTCPDQPLPDGVVVPAPVPPPAAVPAPAAPVPPAAPVAPQASPPANPGNAVSCGDFATWPEAQGWFDTYHGPYGDVAGLDGDGDLVACESLPGR
ncbi:MAG: hypothetical protein JWP95_1362 [Actinotalea sp.]|nr:hypothetical protein [Actinotalea sp.]